MEKMQQAVPITNLTTEDKVNLVFEHLLRHDVQFLMYLDEKFKKFQGFKENETVFYKKDNIVGLAKILKFNLDGTVKIAVKYQDPYDWPDHKPVHIYVDDEDSGTKNVELDKLEHQKGILYKITYQEYFSNGKPKKSKTKGFTVVPNLPNTTYEEITNFYYDAQIGCW